MRGHAAVHTDNSCSQVLEDLKGTLLYDGKSDRLEGVTIQTQTFQVWHLTQLWRQTACSAVNQGKCSGRW